MSDINDLNVNDIRKFLNINGIKNSKDEYEDAFDLMRKSNTIYKNVPISISEWILAYNSLNKDVKIYSISEIERLSKDDLSNLAKLLGLRSVKIENIVSILNYMNKLEKNF